MKKFKIFDLIMQILVIVYCVIALTSNAFEFYYAYFIVGGAQLLSMLVHEAGHYFTAKGTARRFYHNLSYLLVACMLLTPVLEFTVFVFYLLLFAAPFMAVYYLWLCYKETFIYLKRPLSILK